MADLDTMLGELGVSKDDVSGLVTTVEDDVAEVLAGGGDVAGIIQRRAPNMPIAEVRRVAEACKQVTGRIEQAYMAAAAAFAFAQATRPNSSVTLYARSSGTPCVANTVYELFPRNAKTIQSAPFWFDKKMMLERMVCDTSDISAKFHIVGNSVGFEDDKIFSFRYDTSLVMCCFHIPIHETPWASLSKKRPDQKVAFNASVYFDGPALAEEYFGGLTLFYNEESCQGWSRVFKGMADVNQFQKLGHAIARRVRTNPSTALQLNGLLR